MKKNISLYFTLLAALFLALSAQFMGFLFPLLFILPIYMALNGIKYRKKSGYLLGLTMLPIFLSISVLWIKYFISIQNEFSDEILKLSRNLNISIFTSKFLTIGSFCISILMLILCILVFTLLIKNKKDFK